MNAQEKRALVKRLQAGRKRARRQRPQRLAEVEARIDALADDYRSADDPQDRLALLAELRQLGQERLRLKYGD